MIAASLAPTGALMAFLALWTGSLWGRPTWGGLLGMGCTPHKCFNSILLLPWLLGASERHPGLEKGG